VAERNAVKMFPFQQALRSAQPVSTSSLGSV